MVNIESAERSLPRDILYVLKFQNEKCRKEGFKCVLQNFTYLLWHVAHFESKRGQVPE